MKLSLRTKGAVRAIWIGALFAAGPGLFLSLPIGLGALSSCDRGGLECLTVSLLILLPLIISVPVVMLGWLIVGLPLSAVLARFHRNDADMLGLAGAVVGTFVVLAFLWLVDSLGFFWFAVVGTVGGGVTGKLWGEVLEEAQMQD